MSKSVKELKGSTPLQAPVPPMLATAIGYKGDARFVSFQWTPYGDEAEYSNGRISATGVVSANLLHGFGRVMLQISQTGPFAALNVYG